MANRYILRSDRLRLRRLAPVLIWIGNAVVALWVVLLIVAFAREGAGEARVLVPLLGIPALLVWLLTRGVRWLLAWKEKDDPMP